MAVGYLEKHTTVADKFQNLNLGITKQNYSSFFFQDL